MKLIKVVDYLNQLEETASRNKMTEILAELLKEVDADEAGKLSYLVLGRLGPLYDNPQFALAEKQMVKAIALAFGKEGEAVTKAYKRSGDLGLVAKELAEKSQKTRKEITVGDLYDRLEEIAKAFGAGSQELKIQSLANLLGSLEPESSKFVARMVMGKLRLGFSDKTILDAMSVATRGDKLDREALELAYQIRPDVGWLVTTVKAGGLAAAKKAKAQVGVPIMPMLCQRLKTAKEMIKKMGRVAIEPKFDGTRIAIHFKRKGKEWQVKTFTRNLDENSWMFPELEKMVEHVAAEELILDCEAVGYDPKTDKLVPFQVTITRKRKHEVEKRAAEVPLRFFVFDILYKDGESLIDRPYTQRRKILEETVKDRRLLVVDEYWVTEDSEEILARHKEMLEKGLEGIIVKQIESKYVPGRTGWRWVKMKEVEEAQAKLSDTLDCVVMGFNAGRGKRTQFGLGAFLAGVRDGEKMVTVAKIGTGLTDEQFRELKKKLDKVIVREKPKEYEVNKMLYPDVWVEPKIVVEIAADELTKSPVHTAGLALRFPRLVRFREDKSVDQITTLAEVKEI